MIATRRHALKVAAAAAVLCATGTRAHGNRAPMMAVRMDAALRGHLAGLAPLRNGAPASESLQDRAVVVNFFASWCPPCHPEATILTELAGVWTGRGAAFVSVNIFENFGGEPNPIRLNSFLDRHRPPFPVVKTGQETPALFGGVDRIPTLFVFGPDGRARFVFVHERGASKMSAGKAEIEAALTDALT